ncbi:hypothetical protein [Cellulophaga sp. Hel_I_12]|uniref:hypothetical protein n=1 Tax=Cellulophaga sp. Hel_I_12 TaxID=1249972 RepID=UPI001E33157E|nr:hypothetical protein [Cellulophaga sp. Hel_I_12]
MEMKNLIRSFLLFLVYLTLLMLSSCGTIVFSSKSNNLPPSWFYPNRLEMVRYVYFPDYSFYYDLSANSYVYLDAGVWVRRSSLPLRYKDIDLRRSRYERVRNYTDDNIRSYHDNYSKSKYRTSKNSATRNRN